MTEERAPEGEVVEENIRTLVVGGRTIRVREPGALQLSLVVRILKRVQRNPNPTGEEVVNAIAKAMTMMESMIVGEDDREAVLDMMISREISEQEIAKILQVFTDEQTDEQPPAKKKAAKRVVAKRPARR